MFNNIYFFRLDPSNRPTSFQLLDHLYFTHDKFSENFLPELRKKVEQEFNSNPLLNKIHVQMMESSLEKKGNFNFIHTTKFCIRI